MQGEKAISKYRITQNSVNRKLRLVSHFDASQLVRRCDRHDSWAPTIKDLISKNFCSLST